MRIKKHLKNAIKRIDELSPYPFFYPFIMSKGEIAVFDDAIKRSRHYLEFGLGGSSLRAILKSKAKIYTVESSLEWLTYMRKYFIVRRYESKRLNIFMVDIGPTKEWGRPVSDQPLEIFESYSSAIFSSIDKRLIDLALVDGRFRVACTLKLILECYQNKYLKILIHDFWKREHYHVVLKYLETEVKVDTLGLFSIKSGIDLGLVEKDYERFKLNPD